MTGDEVADLRLAVYLVTAAFVLVTMLAVYWRGRAKLYEDYLTRHGIRVTFVDDGVLTEGDSELVDALWEARERQRDRMCGGGR
jgi:hypothetical protein